MRSGIILISIAPSARLLCLFTAILCLPLAVQADEQQTWPGPPIQAPIQPVAYETPVTNTTGAATITIEQIERAIGELEQNAETVAEVKQQAIENYQAAIKNLQSGAEHDARTGALIAEAENVGQRVAQLKQQLDELKDKTPRLETTELAELEQVLPTTELQLSQFKKLRKDAETELQSRADRRKDIRSRLAVLQEKIIDLNTQLKALSAAEQTAQGQSMIAKLLTRRICLEKEKPVLEAELAKYDAEEAADSVRLRAEVAAANAVYTEKLVGLMQQQINAAREAAAEEAVKKARREAIAADPALKEYAQQNQVLAETSKSIAESLAVAEADLKAATTTHEELLRQFARTRKKVDAVGLTSSVGALLRKERIALPDVESRAKAVDERQKLINDTHYLLFEYEEQEAELSESDEAVAAMLKAAKENAGPEVALLESAATDLVKRKREYLDDLVRTTGQYFDTLIELDTVDRQIIELESEYENYIDQRVLWIRSGPPLMLGITYDASDLWLLSPGKWAETGLLLWNDIHSNRILYLVSLALVGLLLWSGRPVRSMIRSLGETAEKANCQSIVPTLRCLWLTCVISLVWSILLLFIGWRLSAIAGESEFTAAIAVGIKTVALVWASLELVRQSCRKKGIGESHFRWHQHVTSLLRRESKFASLILLPIGFVAATLASTGGVHQRGDIQRIAYIMGMLMMVWFVFRLLRPSGGPREYLAANPSGLVSKLKYVIPVVAMALPCSLAALAAAGYFYTAQALFWRLLATFLFVLLLIVVRSVFYRMLLLRRRQLSIMQARERAAAAEAAGDGTAENLPVGGIVTEDVQADISAHSLQSHNLVSTSVTAIAMVGLWMIWIGVLPALSMVGEYPLIPGTPAATASVVDSGPSVTPMGTPETEPAAGNQEETKNEGIVSSVTVSDVVVAMLIVFVTFVLFRNGPGLLEMCVLQQLPLDASVRYAVTTLVTYVIVMVGTIAACSTIGLQWAQIQWLVTALTFGLAFGLQEMFANFVAGLIILLERPIRVGDVVTVDDVTGVVSRIRIRATSITNWDRKEYVVPNKEFITGRLLNWTLSDKVNRIVVEIGVAYGSDTEQARELLLKVANDHEMVLKDPAAVATFEGFGDNSLNLVLRAFLPSLENRLQVIHELHTAIDKAFREAKLEIAFPQRDLHIRTMSSVPALTLQSSEQLVGDQLAESEKEKDSEAA